MSCGRSTVKSPRLSVALPFYCSIVLVIVALALLRSCCLLKPLIHGRVVQLWKGQHVTICPSSIYDTNGMDTECYDTNVA